MLGWIRSPLVSAYGCMVTAGEYFYEGGRSILSAASKVFRALSCYKRDENHLRRKSLLMLGEAFNNQNDEDLDLSGLSGSEKLEDSRLIYISRMKLKK